MNFYKGGMDRKRALGRVGQKLRCDLEPVELEGFGQ